jgi:beta-galactosidase
MPNHREFDYWSWAPEVDVIAVDHYLKAFDPEAHVELALTADVSRGLAGGEPWMLMEHSTSAVNWQPRNVAKQPGEMIRNSLQHVARGADSVMFFQWRASRFGAEKYHSAMVPHAGTDSKVWREVVELGQILERMGNVAGTTLTAEVAFVFDWQSQWALETRSHPSVDVKYLDQVYSLYRAFWNAGITVDIVAPEADLADYRLVVLPSLYVASETTATNIEQFVLCGGNAVVTYMSGVVDENLHLFEGAFPGAYRDVLGVRVEEFFPLREGEAVSLDDGARADVWCELIHLEGAAALSRFVDGPLPASPSVTVHQHGAGSAWYIGTRLEQEAVNRLIRDVLKTLKIKPPIPMVTAPVGLEVTRRTGAEGSYLFLINHGSETAHVRAKGHDLVSDRQLTGTLSLQGGAVAVVREETN